MPTPKEIEVANAADLVKQQRAKRRPRAPQQLTVGYGYYPASDRRAPTLRLRGAGWNNWLCHRDQTECPYAQWRTGRSVADLG